ncbi:hypothetical protein L1049_007595 [Liquidambar formosana]|uniref:Uncharacterized protein n=1 Tax=Liquidambar formosana TaxID=63359 RepID=A0AAP0S230_LIQFO
MDLFRPVHQQWHLMKLLATLKKDAKIHEAYTPTPKNLEYMGKLELLDIAYFYSYMLRIFAVLNPTAGSLPVLNMLSFTPGFLVNLWGALERSLFPGKDEVSEDNYVSTSKISGNNNKGIFEKNQKRATKDGGNKWFTCIT